MNYTTPCVTNINCLRCKCFRPKMFPSEGGHLCAHWFPLIDIAIGYVTRAVRVKRHWEPDPVPCPRYDHEKLHWDIAYPPHLPNGQHKKETSK